jgi:hypothetical protein
VKDESRLSLEQDLWSLQEELATEQTRIDDRCAALQRKERQAETRLDSIRRELEEVRRERPRLARRLRRKQVLVLKETLGTLADTLSDPSRGAWGDRLPIPAALIGQRSSAPRLVLVLPVRPEVVDRWEDFAETPPLRIALIAHSTLVKIALEHDLPAAPEAGDWDRFLTLSLDLSAMRAESVGELQTVDAALFLDEATPKPWASGGREMRPTLIWVPPETVVATEETKETDLRGPKP